jgi:hypothetical protein
MPKPKAQIFLDANIVIGAGKPPGGPELSRVADLVKAGIVTVLTTDLTVTEVVKKHVQNDFELTKAVCAAHFRTAIATITDTELPAINRSQLRQLLQSTYSTSVKAMFDRLGAKALTIDNVKPSAVFDAYANGSGFFGGEGKRDQFPDAFTFECLKQVATPDSPVIVVSQDGDFDKPVQAETNIILVKSLPELFTELGLEMVAPEVDTFFDSHHDELIKLVDRELSDWTLYGDVEDSEIDNTDVTAVEIKQLVAFKPTGEGDPILVVGKMSVKATADYTHPDWDNASYDSEDKILIPYGDVDGQTELDLDIDFSVFLLIGEGGDPEEFEDLKFQNDDFVYVSLSSYDDYR